jgi:predicted RNA methylase
MTPQISLEIDNHRSFFYKTKPTGEFKDTIPEFEARFNLNNPNKSLSHSGISKNSFEYIITTLQNNSSYTPTYETYEHVSYETTQSDKKYRVKTGTGINSKTKIRSIDINYIGFSIRLSESYEKDESELPKGSIATFTRFIKRSSYTSGPIRIDCSIITNHKIGTSKDTSVTTYEVEVEYTSLNYDDFFDEMYPVLQYITTLLFNETSLPVSLPMVCLETNTIQYIIQDLESNMNYRLHLRGQAINIKRDSDLKYYALTNKLDGERKIIYIHSKKGIRVAYIMNAVGPNYTINRFDSFFSFQLPFMEHPDILIDTELDNGTFYMFDTLFVKDIVTPVDLVNHKERMELISMEWIPFSFKKKQFYYDTMEENIYVLTKNNIDPEKFFKENDGFVFTHKLCSYADTNSNYPHLKYKFSAKLSLDFYIVLDKSSNYPAYPFNYLLFSNKDQYKKGNANYGILRSITELINESIVECLLVNGIWVMLRYRHDRDRGNSDYVIKDVLNDMLQPINVDKMFPYPSVRSYMNILEKNNQTFVYDYFKDSLLTFLYITQPINYVFNIICQLTQIRNNPSRPDLEDIFTGDIQARWLSIARDHVPLDNEILSMIYSLIKQEQIQLYTQTEIDTIQQLYKKYFPNTSISIFDIRSFSMIQESVLFFKTDNTRNIDNILPISKHKWVSSPSHPITLPPLDHVIYKEKLTVFNPKLTSLNPEYKDFVSVESSEYSSLKPWEKPQVSSIYKKWFSQPNLIKRIVDASAHIGVDTIHMAELFPEATIDAFEIIPETTLALQKNVKTKKLENRITVHYEDSTVWIPTHNIDIIYIDPPWGGKGYQDIYSLDLYMQSEQSMKVPDKNINFIIDRWMETGFVRNVILKVPFNFNKNYIKNRYDVKEERVEKIKRDNKPAYYLLHITQSFPLLYKPKSTMTILSLPYVISNYNYVFLNTESVLIRKPQEHISQQKNKQLQQLQELQQQLKLLQQLLHKLLYQLLYQLRQKRQQYPSQQQLQQEQQITKNLQDLHIILNQLLKQLLQPLQLQQLLLQPQQLQQLQRQLQPLYQLQLPPPQQSLHELLGIQQLEIQQLQQQLQIETNQYNQGRLQLQLEQQTQLQQLTQLHQQLQLQLELQQTQLQQYIRELIDMVFFSYRYQPFSYESPSILSSTELEQAAFENSFVKDPNELQIGEYKYLYFYKGDVETTLLKAMRKYHNLEKKYLINQYVHKKSVLDLGAGFGGDLSKYEDVNVSRLIMVEPLQKNIITLKNRLDTTRFIKNRSTLIYALGQEWNKIKPYLSTRVEIVSSFFSMTFLFESINILRGFLHTVNESLVEGGYFIGTMMSGEKTVELLKHVPINGVHQIKDITILKKYEDKAPDTGMKLEIDIKNSIVIRQTEYLAFFSILKREMKSLEFELVEEYDFNPKLDEDINIFSRLNIGFAFQKKPKRIAPISPIPEGDTFDFINLYGESQLLVRTGVQSKYTFYHSYLYNTSHEYRIASSPERDVQARTLHEKFCEKHVEYLDEDTDKMTEDYIGAFQFMENVNIYWIDATTRCPVKIPGNDVKRDYSIIMLHHPDLLSFEPIGILQNDAVLRILPKMNPFLINIHRKRQ